MWWILSQFITHLYITLSVTDIYLQTLRLTKSSDISELMLNHRYWFISECLLSWLHSSLGPFRLRIFFVNIIIICIKFNVHLDDL